ncbi:MAG: DUF3750 domain-containing protein [Rhodospirillales bacterium]|nr:DUF3750 domain-containing protein [Rhodospirillales bacterium]
MRWRKSVYGLIGLVLLGGGTVWAATDEGHDVAGDWRTASRESAGIAPDPLQVTEPVVQVYAARAFSWRGYLGVHTWIATKRRNATTFVVYEVIGWRAYHGLSVVSAEEKLPDRRWFGAMPQVLFDQRGDDAEVMIDDIETVVTRYPYANEYRLWPGPNSNTFTAYVARNVPGMVLDLPPTAIGKDFLGENIFASTPSGSGFQVSLFGLLGVMAAVEEGLEINLLGLTFGIDLKDLALKLPGIGRLSPLSN